MNQKKRNAVEWAMHYRQIVILVVCCLVALGIYSLPKMRKNEFPDFIVRQGLVVAVAPGNTSEEMIEQVTKPLENYIFSYKEVKKEKSFSTNRDGIAYIQVELNDDVTNKDEFWSKFKHGVSNFKMQLPSNVLAVQVLDDFGDTSALLITMESNDKTYRELKGYMDDLQDRLRSIKSVGRMSVYGVQKEQISVILNHDKLAQYALNEQVIAARLFTKGFTTTGGRIKSSSYTQPIYVAESLNTVYDIQQMIVYTDPSGNNIRLKDIAEVKKEYAPFDSYITNNGKKCILLSVEMKKGQNIVKMGEDVNNILNDYGKLLPPDVNIFRITDQSVVVDDSVKNFLNELVIAIVAVVIVVMLLLPMKVALVAASTIPITIFISLGLFHTFGIELNTVTLAALIVTLGMIVDNSIVIIDSYLERLSEGMSRWHASIDSTVHFFKSILSATLAISITFFPFLLITVGLVHDFLLSFPWAITLILAISLLVAVLLVPFMQFYFIRKPIVRKEGKSFSFLDTLQTCYNKILVICFKNPKSVMIIGVASIVLGSVMLAHQPESMLPTADRNQFAVEIYLPSGTSIERTAIVADSLEHMLRKDPRIISVTSFKGCNSPRFHSSYAPQIPGSNFAQFIVNTAGVNETVEVLDEITPKYSNYFPEATIKFKQLLYSLATSPIEVRLSGENPDSLKFYAQLVADKMKEMPEMLYVRTDRNEPIAGTEIKLKEDQASRLGINNMSLETTLAMRYGKGLPLTNVWEGDYNIPVVIKSTKSDNSDNSDLMNELIPSYGGIGNVPLKQVADIVPVWKDGQIVRRNGINIITILGEPVRGCNTLSVNEKVDRMIRNLDLPSDLSVRYGGELEENEDNMPTIMTALVIAAFMIFFILLAHFHRINIAMLIFCSMGLCVFGTALGLKVLDLDFGVTCVLGITSLMGIIVRNGIIMVDYAEELRKNEKMHVKEAIFQSASRRMRPIFLTSAAASMGVIPMILGGSGLWMPMGTVIFFGTLITMIFLLTVLPISYWMIFKGTTSKRKKILQLENQ